MLFARLFFSYAAQYLPKEIYMSAQCMDDSETEFEGKDIQFLVFYLLKNLPCLAMIQICAHYLIYFILFVEKYRFISLKKAKVQT